MNQDTPKPTTRRKPPKRQGRKRKRPYTLKVRLTHDEAEAFNKMKPEGMTDAAFARQKLFATAAQSGDPKADIIWHLSRIGQNLNQIAKAANMGEGFDTIDLQKELDELSEIVGRI
jgi:hypothetical protein